MTRGTCKSQMWYFETAKLGRRHLSKDLSHTDVFPRPWCSSKPRRSRSWRTPLLRAALQLSTILLVSVTSLSWSHDLHCVTACTVSSRFDEFFGRTKVVWFVVSISIVTRHRLFSYLVDRHSDEVRSKSAYLGWKPISFREALSLPFLYIYIHLYIHICIRVTLSANRNDCRRRNNFYFSTSHKKKHHCARYRSNVRGLRTLFFVFSSAFLHHFSYLLTVCCCFFPSRAERQLREALRDEKRMLQLCLLCKLFLCKCCWRGRKEEIS